MTSNEIREPVQQRSIEKKQNIIKEGFNLICSYGYHNINTAQIAKAAGVSTGIIYNYFEDKHDILLAGIEMYTEELFFPLLNIDTDFKFKKSELKDVLIDMLDSLLKHHKVSKKAHEEIMAMSHSDKDVARHFNKLEIQMSSNITSLLLNNKINPVNLEEKVHIIIGLMENLCHEVLYHKHKELDFDVMKNLTVNAIMNILK